MGLEAKRALDINLFSPVQCTSVSHGWGKYKNEKNKYTFTELAPTPIQSISFDVCLFVVCVSFVPSDDNRNHVDWRLLVKERIAKIAKLGTSSVKASTNF